MDTDPWLYSLMLALIFLVAFLYSSVGHGGGSGYIAVLALFGTATATVKTSSLMLNIVVSAIAFYHYYRAGHFRWRLFMPFALMSVPFAYIGAGLPLADAMYKKILALCLVFSIVRLLWNKTSELRQTKPLNIYWSLIIGACIGLLSGMLGIGGGIILSPILLVLNWANMKETAAVSALFILVNSMAGMGALLQKGIVLESHIFVLILLAISGGALGAYLGSKKMNLQVMKNILSVVLMIAVVKLVFV